MRPPKRRQNDVHPVLLRTTKYYKILLRPQKETHPALLRATKYYKVLLRTTKRPSSTMPYYKGLQKLPKPQLLKQQASKTSISCKTSFKFHKAMFIKLNKYDFCEASATSQDTHHMLRLPRKNDALALTRFQSIAPVTQNAKTTSHFVTWELQNEHFVRDFLHFSYFEGKDCVAVRVYRPMERN